MLPLSPPPNSITRIRPRWPHVTLQVVQVVPYVTLQVVTYVTLQVVPHVTLQVVPHVTLQAVPYVTLHVVEFFLSNNAHLWLPAVDTNQ